MISRITCQLKEWHIDIECNDKIIMEYIKKALHNFSMEDISVNNASDNMIKVCVDSYIYIKYKESTYCASNIKEVLFYVIEAIDCYTKNAIYSPKLSEYYCILHGGCISYDNKRIGILAPSMTGKSTMLCELVLQGGNYMADDYVFYMNGEVVSFPLPQRLRNTTYTSKSVSKHILFEGYNPYTQNYEFIMNFKQGDDLGKLNALFVLERNDKYDNCIINRLSYRESFTTLLLNGKRADKEEIRNNYKQLLDIAKQIPLYNICYSKTSNAAKVIIEQLGDNNFEFDFTRKNNKDATKI